MRKSILITVLCFSACAVATTAAAGGVKTSSATWGSGGAGRAATASPAGTTRGVEHGSRSNAQGAQAESGSAAAAVHTPGAVVTHEKIAGHAATVVSYGMLKSISEEERRRLRRAGFYERGNEFNALGSTVWCRDTSYLLQSSIRDCIRLINTR